MRRLAVVFAVVSVFSLGYAQKADPLAPLKGLKPWEVPYLPLEVADTVGATDTLWLELVKGPKAGEWVLNFHVFNDESLFAFSLPLRHDSLISVDSVGLAGTRTDFFQTKLLNKKTSIPNTVTVGLFSALTPGAPLLPPGKGLVLKMFLKAPPARPITARSVAPIMMPPNLEFVMMNGTAIHPAVVRVEQAFSDVPLPAAKPDLKPDKAKKSGGK